MRLTRALSEATLPSNPVPCQPMNAVEIEAAISELAAQPFDAAEFPYAFLAAFGHKDTTLKRLRAGNNNASDLPGGVLLRNHIHIAACELGQVSATLASLRKSPATAKAKAKFILATDGQVLEAEELISGAKTDGLGGELIASPYPEFPNHFGFFLPLAGISTIQEIKNNPIDIRATGRLNKLYVELLRENPSWAAADRRHDMNHFMARLIFCFFAEDTDIFNGDGLFTRTVEQFSARDGSNTHEVLEGIFRAMNTKLESRRLAEFTAPTSSVQAEPASSVRAEPASSVRAEPASSVRAVPASSVRAEPVEALRQAQAAQEKPSETRLPTWANGFPYVNGGLFSGSTETPRFTPMARTYLLAAGRLKWREINPDIFGSMIQAVADDEERGALGMHYTSVPNILKVLNPLFLDDLREQLNAAGDNRAKLLNLRKRMARIRVFDPACGSGNFLVIAYKQMREIEAEINIRRGEAHLGSEIPLTNFRGIELRDFPAEIARLALIIAEFQCDVKYRGQKDALLEFLPLNAENWITCGNALRLDWLSVCPPTGTGVKMLADDLFRTPLDQTEIDFKNEGGETYICGNPPYLGSKWQSPEQKADLNAVFRGRSNNWKLLDYVAGWFMKAADYGKSTQFFASFVATNSICQGQQVSALWPEIFRTGSEIAFAHSSFKWANLASHNAGVTVVIVGISNHASKSRLLMSLTDDGALIVKQTENISPYLIAGQNVIIASSSDNLSSLPEMVRGNSPTDGGHLLIEPHELSSLALNSLEANKFIRPFIGSRELISGTRRFCIWIDEEAVDEALAIPAFKARIDKVRLFRQNSPKAATVKASSWPHRFDEKKPLPQDSVICVPVISSENRPFLPADLLPRETVVSNKAFTLAGNELWPLAIICSRINLTWVAAVCARMRTDYSYTNTLGWNTFPVPLLTEQNKADLTQCAENILLAREAHFPATIADLYDPEAMPANLRAAHERNDEVLERIYIGRRFKNDTERLEKLFELYTKMTSPSKGASTAKSKPAAKAKARKPPSDALEI
jgi:hypothetical protein